MRTILGRIVLAAAFAAPWAPVARTQEPDAVGLHPAVALSQGRDLFSQGRYVEALAAFDRAARGDDAPVAAIARRWRIRTALRTAEFGNTRQDAEQMLAAAPRDAEALALYGDALWASGLFEEAETSYRSALDAGGPPLSDARRGLARALASRGQLQDASELVQLALESGAADPELLAVAGSIHERLGRYVKAAEAYESYASQLAPAENVAIGTARARAGFLRAFDGRTPSVVSGVSAKPRSIPFKLVNKKVLVQGRVNGMPVDFVLDTGAERTAITPELATRAGVRVLGSTLSAGVGSAAWRRIGLARVDTLDVGGIRVRNVPVSVRAPAPGGAPRWQSQTFSPLALGLSVVVDYRERHVLLGPMIPADGADLALPMRVHRLPLVRGTLNGGRPAAFIVDTGGEVISLNTDVAESLALRPARRIPLRVYGLEGADTSAFLLPGVDLEVASIAYRQIGVAVLDLRSPSVLLGFQIGGIFGHRFLADRRVSFDLSRSELRLSPLASP
jgi:predicted aspartyl protease/Flp pilus assembly protein TadD